MARPSKYPQQLRERAVRMVVESRDDYEIDGASTLNTWVRNELRLSAKQAAALVRAADTLIRLPDVAHAAATGSIRTEHVAAFTYGLHHIGTDLMAQSQPWLLDVARTCEPGELYKVVKALRDAVFPDELDKAWLAGMDKQDIQVNPVPGGWHVTGFLNVTAGAKLKKVLDSVAAPHNAGDDRSGSERRTQGFDDLLTRILESGLPSDKGIRPHLSVIVDAETLHTTTTNNTTNTDDTDNTGTGSQEPAVPAPPAELAGYGPIGPKLLGYLTCISDYTPILTRKGFPTKQAQILNVGRSQRSATLKQRRAIIARQMGVCAAPGCTHTHLEIHHTIWYSRGGPTDLDLMIGLCVRCHHLIHRELLNIHGNATDGYHFTNRDNQPLHNTYRTRRNNHLLKQ